MSEYLPIAVLLVVALAMAGGMLFLAWWVGKKTPSDAKLSAYECGIIPVTDARAARAELRRIQDRWARAGKVPRDAMREVEGRMRAVEEAVGKAQEEAWRRSNPEARARASSTVAQLRDSILFEGVDIGRYARVQRAIIDKGVKIPAGVEIGFDLQRDLKRGFVVSDSGVVVIAKADGVERMLQPAQAG